MTQVREAKRNYKAAFEALARAKIKIEGSAMQEEELRRDLINSFEEHFEAKVGGRSYVPISFAHNMENERLFFQVIWSTTSERICWRPKVNMKPVASPACFASFSVRLSEEGALGFHERNGSQKKMLTKEDEQTKPCFARMV